MNKFEFPKGNYIEKVFESRKDFIPEVGEQLEKEITAEVEINGEKLKIDYRIIFVKEKENKEGGVVVLLPGFGSGWEGISELGFSLACEGRKVLMPSLPGYGNSENPQEEYYKTDNYENEADVIKKLLDQIEVKENLKVHLVGHSMGSEIMANFAQMYPEKVASLTLLNPAGVREKENSLFLGTKFISSGMHTSLEFNVRLFFSGEGDYEKELKKYIPKTQSPFSKDRISQRLSEAKKVSKGQLLKKLGKIDCPITFISGELDSVYPPGKKDDANSQLTKIIESVKDKTRFEKSVMAVLRHNTTIAPDEITAANIEHYLEKAEKNIEH